MVGSGTRKARATSSVDMPPSNRRVSATCASVESAGWQQVKMRRSRSSCTGPTSSGMPGSSLPGESTAISLSSSRPHAQGDGERLLHRILGDVDVTEDADQGSHRSAGLLAEDPADLDSVELGCGIAVAHAVRPWFPRTDGPRSAP